MEFFHTFDSCIVCSIVIGKTVDPTLEMLLNILGISLITASIGLVYMVIVYMRILKYYAEEI